MKYFFVFILLTFSFLNSVFAQEFRCQVSVNYEKLMNTNQTYPSTDKKEFENMKQAIEDFINSRKWTNLEFGQDEKIDCSFGLVLVARKSATEFEGQLSIQARRPVYNSSYTTGIFNHIETSDFSFTYTDGQPLEFDPNTFYSNLTSTIAYYLYIILGMDFDSFGMMGGDSFYEMARTICQSAASSAYKGWDSREASKARYWFMENHTNAAYAPLREAYYMYHRLGLDMMTKDQTLARRNIIDALKSVRNVHKVRSNLPATKQFIDVKIAELVSIFTPAPSEEQKEVFEIIKEVSPINMAKLKDFNVK